MSTTVVNVITILYVVFIPRGKMSASNAKNRCMREKPLAGNTSLPTILHPTNQLATIFGGVYQSFDFFPTRPYRW